MITDLFEDRQKPNEYDRRIISEAEEIRGQLAGAYSQFNIALDSLEIESAVYRIKALETQYSRLLRNAKLNKNCNIRRVEMKKL